MKKLNLILITFLSVLCVLSCTDLTEELRNTTTSQITPSPAQTIPVIAADANIGSDPVTNTAYARLREGTANHGNHFSVNIVSSDEAAITQKGGDWYDGGIWINMHKHTYSAANGPLLNSWNGFYGSISEVNSAIGNASGKANAIAELKVLRAYYHFKLMDMFGRIRYVDVTGDGVSSLPQLTRAAAFGKVRDELLGALGITEANLADLSAATFGEDLVTTRVNPYRVNRYVALALLARLYLNAEVYTGTAQWQKAHDIAAYVIANGGYSLHNNYAEIFAPDNGSNGSSNEVIWSTPYDEVTNGGMNFAQMTLTYSSQDTWKLQDQPWNGYVALEEAYNAYDANDLRRANNFLSGVQKSFGDGGPGTGAPIIDYAYDDKGTGADQGPVVNYKPAINELAPNGCRDCGTRLGKFSFKAFQRPNMDNDMTLIRITEMYFIQAEAILRGATSSATAISLLNNNIRNRAISGSSFTTATLTLDELYKERGREFFMESLRRQDMIRFGKWDDAWWEKAANQPGDSTGMFPIPMEAIQTGGFTQNSGY